MTDKGSRHPPGGPLCTFRVPQGQDRSAPRDREGLRPRGGIRYPQLGAVWTSKLCLLPNGGVRTSKQSDPPFAREIFSSWSGSWALPVGTSISLPCSAVEHGASMRDIAFKVNIVAVVRVRAAEENVARKVVPTVLAAPGHQQNQIGE